MQPLVCTTFIALFYHCQPTVCVLWNFTKSTLGLWLHLGFCCTGTNKRQVLIMCNNSLFQRTQSFLKYITQPLEQHFVYIDNFFQENECCQYWRFSAKVALLSQFLTMALLKSATFLPNKTPKVALFKHSLLATLKMNHDLY